MASKFGFPQVATSQQQKESAINANAEAVEAVFSGLTTINCAAGGTITLTDAQAHAGLMLRLTGAPAANFNLVVPNTARLYIIDNDTSPLKTATVKTAAGTGVAVSLSTPKYVYCDGTNCMTIST